MPLESGTSRAAFHHNVAEMVKAGHPIRQALAAAYREKHEGRDARAAGILLSTAVGHALFMKRAKGDHAGTWAFPAGKIEDGETPAQAARRETEEETGFRVEGAAPIDERDGFVTFHAEAPEEFEPQLNDEHTEFCWSPMDSPPQPLHPGAASTLSNLTMQTANGEALDYSRKEASKSFELNAFKLEELKKANGDAQGARAREEAKALGALDKREYDANGWYEVLDNPLSKVGVYPYSGRSIGGDADPTKMYGVYRPPEELGSQECIDSFKLMPWTDDHPTALLGDKQEGLIPAEEKGVHGVIGEKVHFDGETLYGNVKVFSERLARKIASGKRELSCGYHCQFIKQDGVYNGEPYQYVQRNIRGNHVASVDKGRMGSGVRVLDAAECCLTFSLDMSEENTMAEKRKDEADGTVDAEILKFIGDSFNSLVDELVKKGCSKEYATKIAGKVAAEKHANGDAKDNQTPGVTTVADSTKGDVKDPAGNGEDPSKTGDLKVGEDRKKARDARDAMRSARDARRAKDEMNEEEEEAEDAREAEEDAEEEKEDEKDESKEARDRRSARDRRAGARDARKGARDRARAARDKAKDKGMDAAEITALVKQEASAAAQAAATHARRDTLAAQRLYQRLSPLVGAFDHDEMSLVDMAAYGLKQLGQQPAKDPVTALDYFLAGRGQSVQARQSSALDSGSREDFVSKYTAAA